MVANTKFAVSSPGKVILHGEHSVVYGKSAIAAAIDLKITLSFEENDTETLQFDFKPINATITFNINAVNELLTSMDTITASLDEKHHEIMVEKVKEFLNKTKYKEDNRQNYQSALTTLYLLCGIICTSKMKSIRKGFTIDLVSEIKVGAGLGSSASFAVCLATAFYLLSKERQPENCDLSDKDKKFISQWAFNGERILHGTPSGVDNTICTFGGVVKFIKGAKPEFITLRHDLRILLVDSNVSRITAAMVTKVYELKLKYPKLVDSIFDSIEECVKEVESSFQDENLSSGKFFDRINDMFQVNNSLLRAIGTSHSKLEEIFKIASEHGLNSKLTGAGGGGFALILLPEELQESILKSLCSNLEQEGFSWQLATIGGLGVRYQKL